VERGDHLFPTRNKPPKIADQSEQLTGTGDPVNPVVGKCKDSRCSRGDLLHYRDRPLVDKTWYPPALEAVAEVAAAEAVAEEEAAEAGVAGGGSGPGPISWGRWTPTITEVNPKTWIQAMKIIFFCLVVVGGTLFSIQHKLFPHAATGAARLPILWRAFVFFSLGAAHFGEPAGNDFQQFVTDPALWTPAAAIRFAFEIGRDCGDLRNVIRQVAAPPTRGGHPPRALQRLRDQILLRHADFGGQSGGIYQSQGRPLCRGRSQIRLPVA